MALKNNTTSDAELELLRLLSEADRLPKGVPWNQIIPNAKREIKALVQQLNEDDMPEPPKAPEPPESPQEAT